MRKLLMILLIVSLLPLVMSAGDNFIIHTSDGTATINGTDICVNDGATCLSDAVIGAGDITGVEAGTGLTGGGASGEVILNVSADICGVGNVSKYNGTHFKCVVDATGGGGGAGKEGDGTYLYNDSTTMFYNDTHAGINLAVNSSDFWDTLNTFNGTQMENNGGILSITISWFTDLWNTIFSTKTTDDLSEGSTNLYDNSSWNISALDDVARIGNCPTGQFVQNTTTGGVECTAPAGGGDITAVRTDGPYLSGGAESGDADLLFNDTKNNQTWQELFDAKTTDDLTEGSTNLYDNQSWNESGANILYILQSEEPNLNVNSSNFWDNYDTANTTWFENIAGVLGLKLSELTSFINSWFSGKDTNDLTEGSTNLYDNSSWNETLATSRYADISVTDTNETTRVDTITGTDCGTGNYSYGFDTSGNIQCREDDTASFTDTNASTACTGTEVLLGNGSCSSTVLSESDPLWSGNSSTVARIGNCPTGQFVQNTTTGGVECTAPSGSGDITAVRTDGSYLLGGQESGDVNITINESYLNATIDDRDSDTTYTNGSGISLVGTEFNHSDTSSQSSSDNSGNTFIQDVVLDTFGHITSLVTAVVSITNIFDQSLNTTDDVVFNILNVTTYFRAITYLTTGTGLAFNFYDDGSDMFMNVSNGGGDFFIEQDNTKLGIFNSPSAGNDFKVFQVFSKEASDITEFVVTKAGDTHASYFIRSLAIAGNSTNTPTPFNCSTYASFIDCKTDLTGADLYVQDDIELEGSIYGGNGNWNITDDGNVTGNYFRGDGSLLTGITGDNSSWNEVVAQNRFMNQTATTNLNMTNNFNITMGDCVQYFNGSCLFLECATTVSIQC